jgi:hypothetical protein
MVCPCRVWASGRFDRPRKASPAPTCPNPTARKQTPTRMKLRGASKPQPACRSPVQGASPQASDRIQLGECNEPAHTGSASERIRESPRAAPHTRRVTWGAHNRSPTCRWPVQGASPRASDRIQLGSLCEPAHTASASERIRESPRAAPRRGERAATAARRTGWARAACGPRPAVRLGSGRACRRALRRPMPARGRGRPFPRRWRTLLRWRRRPVRRQRCWIR